MEKNKTDNSEVSLNWKKQDPFFIDYYELRKKALAAKNDILLGKRQEFLLEIMAFIDYSVDYIDNYDEKIEEIETLLENYKSMEKKDFREKANKLWREISKDHVKYEILPKPEINNDDEEIKDYYLSEEHKGVRELKRVMVKIFQTN